MYCALHVSLRLVSYAFLSAQYKYWAAIILPLQFISNLLIRHRVCQDSDDVHLNSKILNAALSLVAPAAFNLTGEEDKGGNRD